MTSTLVMLTAAVRSNKPSRTSRALARCRDGYLKAQGAAMTQGLQAATAHQRAKEVYKLSMPQLDSMENIRAYIACVAQGINFDVFTGRDGSQLLYASQVALTLLKQAGRESDETEE